MKKTLFGVLAAFVAIAMTSCGGSKTPEQIEQEAQKKFDEKKAELEKAAVAACDASKGGMIQTYMDSLTNDHNANHPEAPIGAIQ